MGKGIAFLILWLAATSSVCSCWAEEAAENAKEKANSAQQSASEAMQGAKEKTTSWADWARGKLSG